MCLDFLLLVSGEVLLGTAKLQFAVGLPCQAELQVLIASQYTG